MTDYGDGPEPDMTHSLSRRQVLAFGASGLATALAGCNGDGPGGGSEQTPPPPGNSKSGERTRNINIQDIKYEQVSFNAILVESIAEYDEVEFTVRVYTSPNLDRESWSQIGEGTFTQSEEVVEHTIDWDIPLGYAQQLHFTIEMLSPESESEEEVYKTRNTIIPFYNAAVDDEMVATEGPRTPSGDWAYSDPYFKTDFWFSIPDDSPFNTPEVPEDEYDQDWYDYRNITMTAAIRFPNYENISEFDGDGNQASTHSPAFDWAIINVNLDAWELIEAVRWNSIATQKLESGEFSYGDGGAGRVENLDDYGSASESSRNLMLNASERKRPYDTYVSLRFGGARWDEEASNPLVLNGGRPISLRIANKLENALDNPSFNTIDSQEYHKAIALQVFVGHNPFSYTTGEYVSTTEETINNWYKVSTGQLNSSGNCQDATAMYGGIAVHLLDSTVGIVGMQGNVGYHIMGGLLNFPKPNKPYETWPDHPSPNAAEEFTFSTDSGEVTTVECTYSDPTIGWKNPDGSDYELASYLASTTVQSEILLNNNNEPDVDGELKMPVQDHIIPWELHTTEYTVIDSVENF